VQQKPSALLDPNPDPDPDSYRDDTKPSAFSAVKNQKSAGICAISGKQKTKNPV